MEEKRVSAGLGAAPCRYYNSPRNAKNEKAVPRGQVFTVVDSKVVKGVTWLQISKDDPNPWAGKWVKKFHTIEAE